MFVDFPVILSLVAVTLSIFAVTLSVLKLSWLARDLVDIGVLLEHCQYQRLPIIQAL